MILATVVAVTGMLVAACGGSSKSTSSSRGATDVHKAIGEYFVGLLNKLGSKATPQFLSADIQCPYVQNSKNEVQIVCSAVEPPPVDHGGGHLAACHHPLGVDDETLARVRRAAPVTDAASRASP